MTQFSKETCDINNLIDIDERQNWGGNTIAVRIQSQK